ncbi:12077_t:CDS:2, partial [Racocetra fulgida]
MSKAEQKIDLNRLDLNHTYTFEEFEYLNEQLKYHTLEINGQPVDLFELDEKGKLVPMSQATHWMEVTVATIVGQLDRWNIQTRQNGDIKTAQGGFNFNVEGRSKFEELDHRFKHVFFATGSGVQL